MKTKKVVLIISLVIMSLGIGLALGSHFFSPAVTASKFSLDDQSATIAAITKTMPSVVSIVVYDQEPLLNINSDGTTSSSSQRVTVGEGTGFIISADGLVLTNRHVVEAAQGTNIEYKIILNNKSEYYAQLIGKDPINDLAVLKIAETKLPYLEMGASVDSPIGLTVMAIGNALGRYNNSVTKGIISGLGRHVIATGPNGELSSLDNVLQTDAEINEGNSGGPLINLDGKVIGINVAVDKGGTGLGFAIPIDDAKSLIDSVRRTGRIIRVRLGVRYEMIDPFLASEKQLVHSYGALVTKDDAGNPAIVPDSPAAKAGLLEGDIIFEVNAIKIDGINTLLSVIQRYKPGDKIGLKIQRGNQVITKVVVLDEFTTQ
jgi:serine protease Do